MNAKPLIHIVMEASNQRTCVSRDTEHSDWLDSVPDRHISTSNNVFAVASKKANVINID